MRIFIAFFLAASFALSSLAADFRAQLNIKTGDSQLDLHLSNVNSRAATPAGATLVRTELKESYKLSDRELSFLSKKGYTLAEIQYLALMAKQSGKPINNVAALHSQGIGWGVLAKRLGVRPAALRKQIVAEKKREKTMDKGEGRKSIMPQVKKQIVIRAEKKEMKPEPLPQPHYQQNRPMQPQRLEGQGMGGGRGKGR